jgi:hypothetical protein
MSGKYSSARKSRFSPTHPEKWVGADNIIARSFLEKKWFTLFDKNESVTNIGSENIVVPYFDPVKNKMRRYFVDLVVRYVDTDGLIKIKLIEIKSSSESSQPKKPKRMSASYKSAVLTWITNDAKWKAATAYAKQRGWEFVVLTERQLRK